MKKFFLLISLCAVAFSAFSQSKSSPFNFENDKAKYNLFIDAKKANISGICIMKQNAENVVGSVVNEFGIKIFDFIFDKSKQKMKLRNTIGFIDKWYIRKIIKADLKYIFLYDDRITPKKKCQISVCSDSVVLRNLKYDLTYKFIPLQNQNH